MNFPICKRGGLRDAIAYLKRRGRARAIARACGVPLEKSELRLVAGEEHPKDVLAYWHPEKKRTQLACLWALTHHAATFEYWRPRSARGVAWIVPDPAVDWSTEETAEGFIAYSLLYDYYISCDLAGIKTCKVHSAYQRPKTEGLKRNEKHISHLYCTHP